MRLAREDDLDRPFRPQHPRQPVDVTEQQPARL
jgi:hypothetical protein